MANAQGATASTQIIDLDNYCVVDFGIQDCATQHMVLSTVVNPSGNTVYSVHETFSETWSDTSTGQVINAQFGQFGLVELTVGDLVQALNNQNRYTYLLDGMICTFDQAFTYSNGVVRFEHTEGACT